MAMRNFNGYFLCFGKLSTKISEDKVSKAIKKINIEGHSFIFYPKSLGDIDAFISPSLRLQFFTWSDMKKVAVNLSRNNWTIHINVDDLSLQDDIEKLRSDSSHTYDEFWNNVANLIISTYSVWPTKIVVEPSTFVRIVFMPPFSEEIIEIKYGENIYVDDTFFNEKAENLKMFLETYFVSIKEEIAVE